jgi:hypothetical protein
MQLRHLIPTAVLLRGVVALAALAAFAPIASAQALDTPTLTQTGGGFFRIDMDVQAGASGAPNGFAIQWMKRADFEIYGWPSDTYDPLAAYCEFNGVPTLTTDARSSSYVLEPNGIHAVQMGDLFDETGIYGTYLDAVVPGEYAFRVWALGNGVDLLSGSLPSPTQYFSTMGNAPECTQGFWKNHFELWPSPCPISLGSVAYTPAQLLAIYTTPAAGNGLISLAHQLITVKLNACNGSDVTNVAAAIAAADALIGALVVPPSGAGYLHPSLTSALTETLDQYNNGIIPGVVACQGTKSKPSTWGTLKALYR